MKKILLFTLLFYSFSSSAQLIDTMGALGISGLMAANSAKSTEAGLNAVEIQDIINKMQMEVVQYKISNLGYSGTSNSKEISSLSKYQGKIETSEQGTAVTLFHVKQSVCQKLSNTGANLVYINSVSYNTNLCQQDNKMTFIFE